MSDEELALKAKNGDANAMNELLGKYKTMVGRLCRSYFLLGGDIEDLNQEGMIGLYKAIQGYNQNKNVKFKTFANVCIKHQLLSAIKIASSQKNMVLSSAIPIAEEADDEDEGVFEIILPSSLPQPDDSVIEKESKLELQAKMLSALSPLEIKVLSLYLKGFSYKEIAQKAQISTKSIDNALSRIKKKLTFIKK